MDEEDYLCLNLLSFSFLRLAPSGSSRSMVSRSFEDSLNNSFMESAFLDNDIS